MKILFKRTLSGIRTRFTLFFVSVCAVLLNPVSALAAEDEGGGGMDWVLGYFLVCLCLGLAVAILLRPCNRSDSAFSQEELDAQHEEKMKQMLKH